MGEISKLPWVEQEEVHPQLQELLDLPFGEVLGRAAEHFIGDTAVLLEADIGEDAVFGARVPLAENDYAIESLRILLAKRAMAVSCESRYKSAIREIARPNKDWAIAVDDDGSHFYWSESLHGDNAVQFALAATDCEAVSPYSAQVIMMRWNLSVGIYRQLDASSAAEFTISSMPPFDLKASLGDS